MEISVNYLAVIAASVTSMALGFLWYSPAILGKQWMKEKGYTKESLKEEQKKMSKLYMISFLVALLTAYVLSHVITLSMNFYDYSKVSAGLSSAFWIWLGFILPVQTTHTIFGDKNWKLLGIDTGYQLGSILIMGLVLGLF